MENRGKGLIHFVSLGFSFGHRDQFGSRRGQDHPDRDGLRQQVHPPRRREERARSCLHRKARDDHLSRGKFF